MKLIISLLVVIVLFLQYKLWFQHNSIIETWQLEKQIAPLQTENSKLQARNKILQAEVKDLKTGYAAIEERARNELGMTKKGERFYQFVHPTPEKDKQ